MRKNIHLIYKLTSLHPESVILSDVEGEYCGGEIWSASSSVYRYLVEHGVGREDVVMVLLPRGAKAVVAALGVWRAGAAVTIHEDWNTQEWIDFVKRDARCKMVIDAKVMEEMSVFEPLEGWKEADEHDLAYITYTTGTTGEKKGVMHEYGTLERIIGLSNASLKEGWKAQEEYRTALMITLHSAITSIVLTLCFGAYLDIVPYDVVENPDKLKRRLVEKRIVYTYMSPMMLEKIGPLESPYLECVGTGFEPATNMCSSTVPLINEYGMTECPYMLSEFVIDKSYEIVPIGKPICVDETFILDKNGLPVAEGEIGEICFVNHFCRGYLNRPEATAAQFRNGLFHTRDLGKVLPDGNWVMLGRVNDSVETPSGIVVALEIEAIARSVMEYHNIYVKVFEDNATGGQGPVICVYADRNIDLRVLRERLSQQLPAYKLPTDFVQVDAFKYNNGKVIRLELRNPHEKI